MKSKLSITLIIVLLLMAIITPAYAQIVPDVSGGYTIKTTPAADPATGAITVQPGDTIKIRATADVVYSGNNYNGVKINGNVYAYLYKSGAEVSTASKAFTETFDLVNGQTYHAGDKAEDEIDITVPTTATNGYYQLKIVASAAAEYMGMSYNQQPIVERLVVLVAAPTPMPATGATATPTPVTAPTPVPTTYGVDSSTVTITSGGNTTFKSGEVSGSTDSGAATGSVDVNLTHVPKGSLTMHIQSDPDPAAETQFMLAAADSGCDIKDIACVLVVDHPALANGADIGSATITMKVSKAWVDAHGGIAAIKILRYSDGVSEALDTTCIDPASDPMVFQAYSPHGLSQFALAAVAQLPVTAAESAPTGVQVGSGIIIGIIAVIVILLVAITGVVYMLKNRGKKNKKE